MTLYSIQYLLKKIASITGSGNIKLIKKSITSVKTIMKQLKNMTNM